VIAGPATSPPPDDQHLELNLGRYDRRRCGKCGSGLMTCGRMPHPLNLAALYAARYQEYRSYLIYLRVLWEMYGAELEEEAPPETRFRLTNFQNDAYGGRGGYWRSTTAC